MDIYEDSIPFSFTPDGLDEATIDALIDEASARVPDETFDEVLDEPEIAAALPVYGAAGKQASNDQAA